MLTNLALPRQSARFKFLLLGLSLLMLGGVHSPAFAQYKAEERKDLPRLPDLVSKLDSNGQPCPASFLLKDQPDHVCNHDGAFVMRRMLPAVPVSGGQFGVEVQMLRDLMVVMTYADPKANSDPSLGVYHANSDGSWSQVARVVPKDRTHLDFFGGAMAVTDQFIVSGAAHSEGVTADNKPEDMQGRVYVFKRQRASLDLLLSPKWEESQVLTPPGRVNQIGFGAALALSDQWLAVSSSPRDQKQSSSSGVTLFKLDAGKQLWTEDGVIAPPAGVDASAFGQQLALAGNKLFIAVGGGFSDKEPAGAVLIYDLSKPNRPLISRIDPPEGRGQSGFARSIDVLSNAKGTLLAIGATRDSVQGQATGAVYLYGQAADGSWSITGRLTPEKGEADEGFGSKIRLDNNRILVSAPFKKGIGMAQSDIGAVYLFDRVESTGKWQQKASFIANDVAKDLRFGRALAFAGDQVIVGAPTNSAQVYYGGALYFIRPTTAASRAQ
jgi:hypothetical protein